MKIAALITVAPPPEKSDRAVALQLELLDRLGSQLHSIRLVEPRLFDCACRAAIAEAPDVLIAFCDARLARRVGQLGHDNGIPVGLVCQAARPAWASRICATIAKDRILSEFARGVATAAHIDAGAVGDKLFFERAVCGGVANIAEMKFTAAYRFVPAQVRLALLAAAARHPNVRIQSAGRDVASACAFQMTMNGDGSLAAGASTLHCSVYAPETAGAGVRAMWRALRGRSWQHRDDVMRFDAPRAIVDGGRSVWISLDGDPMRFHGAPRVRIVPRAVEVVGMVPAQAIPAMAAPRVRQKVEPF